MSWAEYEAEELEPMISNLSELEAAVIGHKIVNVTRSTGQRYNQSTYLTLDNGKVVELQNSSDCCAYTELSAFLLNVDLVDHVITGVRAEDGYSVFHIYADMGDVLKLDVSWSSGNFPYYGYGFYIQVRDAN